MSSGAYARITAQETRNAPFPFPPNTRARDQTNLVTTHDTEHIQMAHLESFNNLLTAMRSRSGRTASPRTLVLALIMLASLAFTSAHATLAAQDGPGVLPSLSSTSADPAFGGTVVVLGTDFTAGGDVFLAISDPSVDQVNQVRWTTASDGTFGPNGSSDPALGFHPGGVVYDVFVRQCEHPVVVRAFDAEAGTWSNPLELEADCAAN